MTPIELRCINHLRNEGWRAPIPGDHLAPLAAQILRVSGTYGGEVSFLGPDFCRSYARVERRRGAGGYEHREVGALPTASLCFGGVDLEAGVSVLLRHDPDDWWSGPQDMYSEVPSHDMLMSPLLEALHLGAVQVSIAYDDEAALSFGFGCLTPKGLVTPEGLVESDPYPQHARWTVRHDIEEVAALEGCDGRTIVTAILEQGRGPMTASQVAEHIRPCRSQGEADEAALWEAVWSALWRAVDGSRVVVDHMQPDPLAWKETQTFLYIGHSCELPSLAQVLAS